MAVSLHGRSGMLSSLILYIGELAVIQIRMVLETRLFNYLI